MSETLHDSNSSVTTARHVSVSSDNRDRLTVRTNTWSINDNEPRHKPNTNSPVHGAVMQTDVNSQLKLLLETARSPTAVEEMEMLRLPDIIFERHKPATVVVQLTPTEADQSVRKDMKYLEKSAKLMSTLQMVFYLLVIALFTVLIAHLLPSSVGFMVLAVIVIVAAACGVVFEAMKRCNRVKTWPHARRMQYILLIVHLGLMILFAAYASNDSVAAATQYRPNALLSYTLLSSTLLSALFFELLYTALVWRMSQNTTILGEISQQRRTRSQKSLTETDANPITRPLLQ